MRFSLSELRHGLRTKLIGLFVAIKVLPLLMLAFVAWEGVRLLGERLHGQTQQMTRDVRQSVSSMGEMMSLQAQDALNQRAREELERLTTDTARNVATFLYGRDEDVQQAARLAPNESLYAMFIKGRSRLQLDAGQWVLDADRKQWVPVQAVTPLPPDALVIRPSNAENETAFHYRPPETVLPTVRKPLYHEMTFVGLDGREQIKIPVTGLLPRELRDVSRRENTWSKAETYFAELRKLKPGEIYVSEVIGTYVGTRIIGPNTPPAAEKKGVPFKPEEDAYAGMENPVGKRFRGIVRWATPVVENGRISGYVTLALDHDHLMALTDILVPTPERYVRLPDASSGNYAFMWDHRDRAIAHPRHHSIPGFDANTGQRVPPWLEASMHERWQASGQPIERFLETMPVFEAQSRDKTPAAAMTAAGKVGLDCRYLNFAPQCVGWHDLTRNGGSGSFLIKWSGVWKITTAAAIPYFTGQYGRTPRGFGYVTIGANIEDYQLPAQVMGKQLETRVQDLEGQIERQQGDIRDEIEQRVGRMGFELGFSTLIMIVLVVAIAVWLANLITRRIDETIDGLQRVEEGDYAYRFEKPADDELGRLTDSLNRMTHNVEQAYEDLKATKRSEAARLAEMVEQRTEELKHARIEAEKASSAKSLFLSNMSHEIRTPLNGVLGLAQVGLRENGSQPRAREVFRRILDSGKLLLTIINDILDFSKIEAGKLQIERVPFRPAEVIEDALRAVRPGAEDKGLELVSDLSGVPDACVGDPARIQQILLNLLSNALKFTHSGSIRLSASAENEALVFRVADTGIGIDPADLARLFEPFEQADSSTTRKYGGTGLGLTISARLARLMGGGLSASSRLGNGSTFELRVPLELATVEVPVRQRDNADCGGCRLAGIRLLVAEDNEVNRLVIDAMLRAEGAAVVMVGNGVQAVRAVEEGLHVDAVLMDVQMPEMDGLEATRRIKVRHPGLPVIGQTAYALKDEQARCLAAGMVGSVHKPLEIDTLVEAIRAALGRPTSSVPGSELVGAAPPETMPAVDRPADSPGDPAMPVIDWPALRARYPGREAFIERLLGVALENHADDAQQLRDLLARGEDGEVGALAHRLKGMAGNLCASEVQHLGERVMVGVRQGQGVDPALALALAAALDRLVAALRSHVAS